ncbi:MAG TPA: acetylglutamate kinase [Saprospiraceae bacterium]|mgnify:CR=1 FL=1|nr:acetylglutamate kinase [Saprospiraceae bacterium]HPN70986.1 acetylglutamate kinase [Saprospiraceae bacterium]
MNRLHVVKIGGNIVDDVDKLNHFLTEFAKIEGSKILIHGGGKIATSLAEKMGIEQTMVNGRRITDAQTLEIVTMVYVGLINKKIVAKLQSLSCNALGLCGADGNLIKSHKRTGANIDYGFVGDVDLVNQRLLNQLLDQEVVPIIAPITHDQKGTLLNTNADTVAQEVACAMASIYDTTLIYSFEKEGVLLDVNDEDSVISKLDLDYYNDLKSAGKIFAGMIPKLDNAFMAIEKGLKSVIIGNADHLDMLITGIKGTTIG